ncbi:hypothetical protein HHI36_014001 [Cryptolaemus montrouzieri]|uniref:F-box domain-containing protein n=1 Tax=Cryptolaemus montrouzieri TaxID=559131 RepID=A0ABD2N204_9CUCU
MYKCSELEQFADRVLEFTTRYNSRNQLSYGPGNLRGKYTKYPSYGDFPETYTLRCYGEWWKFSEATYQKPYMTNDVDPLGTEDFVTVHFNQAVLPTKIYIYETYTLEQSVSCFVDTIRLELNCSKLDHHSCFDAVLLSGRPAPESTFQLKCFEAFGLPQIATVTTICDSNDTYDSSSKRSRKKNYFKKLPYEVIVQIFYFLDLKSLCRCACVSKQWNEIARDSLLYQNISLKKYWYTVDTRALDFLQNRCKNLKKLDLSWCGNDDRNFPRKFYEFFTSTCQNLTHISLGNATYLNGSHLAAFSRCPDLVELRLRNVTISDLEFCHADTLTKLTKLVTLDFYSTNITTNMLLPLLKVNPNLKYLNLDFCDEIENMDDVIEVVAEYNKQIVGWSSWKAKRLSSRGVGLLGHCHCLEDLDLGWGLHVLPPENAIEKIALGCKRLKRLILSGWRPLVDAMLLPLIENCKQLEQLDLLSIKGISKEFVEKTLNELPNLRLLELSFCDSIPVEKIEQWRISFPHIKIQRCSETE